MEEGLRERKKRETKQRIADMAMGLFMTHGFERVTVAEVARVADVSVNTVFNYFGTKEDLFYDRANEAEDLPSRVVRERRPGESVLEAFHRDYLESVEARDWRYGLNEGSDVFSRMVGESPTLMARMRELEVARMTTLAATLAEELDADPDDMTPTVVAMQVLTTLNVLSRHSVRRLMAGESWAEILPWLREQAGVAFELLEKGVGSYGATTST